VARHTAGIGRVLFAGQSLPAAAPGRQPGTMRPALLGSRVPRGLRRAVWSLVCLVAAAALVAPAAAAAGASLWVGLEGSGFLGAELDGLLGPVTLVVQSRNGQEPRSTPQEKFLSATPIAAAETVLGAFYTVDLGPVSVGVGGVHLRRERTGMVREADLSLAAPLAGGQAGARGRTAPRRPSSLIRSSAKRRPALRPSCGWRPPRGRGGARQAPSSRRRGRSGRSRRDGRWIRQWARCTLGSATVPARRTAGGTGRSWRWARAGDGGRGLVTGAGDRGADGCGPPAGRRQSAATEGRSSFREVREATSKRVAWFPGLIYLDCKIGCDTKFTFAR